VLRSIAMDQPHNNNQQQQQQYFANEPAEPEEEEDSKLPAAMVYREDNVDEGDSSSFVLSQERPLMLDEERIHPTSMDASIREADVLCGRGKLSFNHGRFLP